MKIVVKFFVNDSSVTNSSFFLASSSFLVLFGEIGDMGDPALALALFKWCVLKNTSPEIFES